MLHRYIHLAYEIGATIIPILQIKKLRTTEVKYLISPGIIKPAISIKSKTLMY